MKKFNINGINSMTYVAIETFASIADNLAAAAVGALVADLVFGSHEIVTDLLLYGVFAMLVLSSLYAKNFLASVDNYDEGD